MPLSDPSTPDEVDRVVIDGLGALALLPPQVQHVVAESFRRETFSFGEPIVRQGEPGDSFCETSLLDGSPRNATVRASGAVTVLRLDQSVFDALVRLHPEVRQAL